MSLKSDPKVIAIIPARGGSKRLPGKNIKPLLGRPLIDYSIEAGLGASLITRVLVSTDSPEIAEVARQAGAEVPFLRPPDLATNGAPTLPVLLHCTEWLGIHGWDPDIVVVLQPTSPLRRSWHIDQAIELLLSTQADSVVGICKAEHSPSVLRKVVEGRVIPFLTSTDTVDPGTEVYRLNGALYVTWLSVMKERGLLLGADTRGYVMDPEYSVDIDTELDFLLAEALLRRGGHETSVW